MLATAASPPPLTVKLFGTFALRIGEREVPLRGRKACALLAYLVLAVRQRATREHIADLLWTDRGANQARASLRQTLAELRAILEVHQALEIRRGEIFIRPGALLSDLARAMDACHRCDLVALAGVLADMDGTLLETLHDVAPSFDEWLAIERPARTEQLVAASIACVEQAGMSRLDEALAVLRALDRLDPLNEGVAKLGMRLDHAAGDSAALHRRYRRLAAQLQAEFGAQPAEATRSLFQHLIKAKEPADVPATPDRRPAPGRPQGLTDDLVPAVIVAPLQVVGNAGLNEIQAEFCTDDMRLAISSLHGVKVLATDTGDVTAFLANSADSIELYLLSGKLLDPGTGPVAMLQLANARDRTILWSESIRVSGLKDPVATLVAKAAGAVQPAIDRDLARGLRESPSNTDERAMYTRARLLIRSAVSLEDTLAGVAMLERIVSRNQRHLGAHLLLARMFNNDFWQQMVGHDVASLRERGAEHLAIAAAMEPDSTEVRVRRAWVLLRRGAYDSAARDFEAVLGQRQLDPDILNQCAVGLCFLGEVDQAQTLMQQAFELNPFAPSDYHADYATMKAFAGRAEEAEDHFLVSGETGLLYEALRIANFGALPAPSPIAEEVQARFAAKFNAAWQAARSPVAADVIQWIGSVMPLRRQDHRDFVARGLGQRLPLFWPAS